MQNEEQKEWWEDEKWWFECSANECVGEDGKMALPKLFDIEAEAARRARAEVFREMEERISEIENYYPEDVWPPCRVSVFDKGGVLRIPSSDRHAADGARFACKRMREEIQAMKGEVV